MQFNVGIVAPCSNPRDESRERDLLELEDSTHHAGHFNGAFGPLPCYYPVRDQFKERCLLAYKRLTIAGLTYDQLRKHKDLWLGINLVSCCVEISVIERKSEIIFNCRCALSKFLTILYQQTFWDKKFQRKVQLNTNFYVEIQLISYNHLRCNHRAIRYWSLLLIWCYFFKIIETILKK